jgi:hypothetical protein
MSNKYEEILNEVDDNFKGIQSEDIYKYVMDNMEDDVTKLMEDYIKERETMTSEEVKTVHKLFKRLGIIQKIIIDRS